MGALTALHLYQFPHLNPWFTDLCVLCAGVLYLSGVLLRMRNRDFF